MLADHWAGGLPLLLTDKRFSNIPDENFVWLLAILIPFSLIESDQRFDVVPMVTETLLAFIFVTIEQPTNVY